MSDADTLLARARAIAMTMPEAVETPPRPGGSMTGFAVRGKTFAWFCDNHHGDGRIALWLKAPPGAQEALVGGAPSRFFVPPYVGPKGWVGARLDVPGVDWDEVADLIEQSYGVNAPKRLRTG